MSFDSTMDVLFIITVSCLTHSLFDPISLFVGSDEQQSAFGRFFRFWFRILLVSAPFMLLLLTFCTGRHILETSPEKQIYTNKQDVSLSLQFKENEAGVTLDKVTPQYLQKNANFSGSLGESSVDVVGRKNNSTYTKEFFYKKTDFPQNKDKTSQNSTPTKVVKYTEKFQRTFGPFTFKPESRTYLKFYYGTEEDIQTIKELLD